MTNRWTLGWVAGIAVVGVAGGLILAITALAKRIARQADDIVDALDAARENTDALFDVAQTNDALARTLRGLRSVREGSQAR